MADVIRICSPVLLASICFKVFQGKKFKLLATIGRQSTITANAQSRPNAVSGMIQ